MISLGGLFFPKGKWRSSRSGEEGRWRDWEKGKKGRLQSVCIVWEKNKKSKTNLTRTGKIHLVGQFTDGLNNSVKTQNQNVMSWQLKLKSWWCISSDTGEPALGRATSIFLSRHPQDVPYSSWSKGAASMPAVTSSYQPRRNQKEKGKKKISHLSFHI